VRVQVLAASQHASPRPAADGATPLQPTLLGVTNRMFLRALPHWPHVLSVGPAPDSDPSSSSSSSSGGAAADAASSVDVPGSGAPRGSESFGAPHGSASAPPPPALLRRASSTSALPPLRAARPSHAAPAMLSSPLALFTTHVEQLWTPLPPSLTPDTALLNRLDQVERAARVSAHRGGGGGGGGGANSADADADDAADACDATMRAEFHALTAAFLAPFAPYCTPAAPPPPSREAASALYRAGAGPPLLPFDADAFLAALRAPGASQQPERVLLRRCGSAAALHALYASFVAGAPFRVWLACRCAAAERAQSSAWAAARAAMDVPSIAAALTEVELVDAFGALEASLAASVEAAHVAYAMTAAAAAISAGPPGAKLSFGAGGASSDGSKPGAAQLPPPPPETAEAAKLRADLRALFEAMPDDMRAMMATHPSRAALLRLPSRGHEGGEEGEEGGDGAPGRLGGLLSRARGRLGGCAAPPTPPTGLSPR
jgi:hypothetical protein